MSTCIFYVLKKKRNCRMTVLKGHDYCAEHQPKNISVNGCDKRITCPLDNKHTCYEKNLKKHLRICNAREKDNGCDYIVKGVNSSIEVSKTVFKLKNTPQSSLHHLIRKIQLIYEETVKDHIGHKYLTHNLLDDELTNNNIGCKAKKHLIQNSALLEHLRRNDLLQSDTCFIEFGAGRGKLSYWLSKATDNLEKVCVLLIDRSTLRHKQENKVGVSNNLLHRIKANISDIRLEKIPFVTQYQNIVGVTKHLCGSATDLALKSIENAIGNHVNINGILLSFCCHHQCTWSDYVGKQFFMDYGLNDDDFQLMISIASWAVCGKGRNRNDLQNEDVVEELENRKQYNLTKAEKEKVGFYAKAVIDYGRFKYVQNLGFNTVYLSYYVSKDVTPENLCLLATNYNYDRVSKS